MKLNPILSALMISGALLAPHGLAQAQAKPIELRYTSGAPPKGNPWAMQIERIAKDVDEESKGELKIQPFLGSQLGSEQDTVQQVARGRIDMGGFSGGSAALVLPEVALLLMPFYFRNAAEVDCVLDNHVQKHTVEALATRNDRQSAVRVTCVCIDTEVDAPQPVDDVFEALKVDFHVVRNSNTESFRHRRRQPLGTFPIFALDTPTPAGACNGNPQVAGNAHQ